MGLTLRGADEYPFFGMGRIHPSMRGSGMSPACSKAFMQLANIAKAAIGSAFSSAGAHQSGPLADAVLMLIASCNGSSTHCPAHPDALRYHGLQLRPASKLAAAGCTAYADT
eukprot:3420534-Amphidinium_carterae.3